MRLFMVDMHNTIVRSFGRAFAHNGWTLELAGHSFNSHERFRVGYGRKWGQEEIDNEIKMPNVKALEVEELLSNPPDVYMIMCAEQQADQLKLWEAVDRSKTKLVYYSGNDGMINYYDPRYAHHILAADISTYAIGKTQGRHVLYYFPWVDYDTFTNGGPSDNMILRSYINEYQKLFPAAAVLANGCVQTTPQIKWEAIQGQPKSETIRLMHESMATLHVKNLEGYGFAITESLACGRPVILHRPWADGRSYVNWCLEGQSALYFSNTNEYTEKITKLIEDADYRHALQQSSAATVRRVINNEEQSTNLKKFIEEI